jgi:2-octaprenylphenol hydroxylase
LQAAYDIIIIGGGIIGTTLACALSERSSLSIAILEAKKPEVVWDESCYDHRVSAITLSSQRIFQSINVWEKIKAKRVSSFTKMHVWDETRQGHIHFDSAEIARAQLGFIIENKVIQASLWERIKECQIDVLAPVQLQQYQLSKTDIALKTSDEKTLKAKCVIAADGAQSWMRKQAGIQAVFKTYHESAIVCSVTTTLPHEKTARQVFLNTGPLAFLPLDNEYDSSIVWSLPADLAKEYAACSPDLFKEILAREFSHELGSIKEVTHRYCFPLQKHTANRYISERLALVGDAAHVIHPLAGQGVNVGLLDAGSLVDVISQSIQMNRDFSSQSELRQYERWRKADNAALLIGIDWIKSFFASDKKMVTDFRMFGMNQLDKSHFFKNWLANYACGNRSNLPTLASERYTPVHF